ncbi:MBL fold metallo-hydrolase [Bacillaceae bacterium SIJ1]|uniref:MBL fold metallo-hydrolase n=1 Tax=Litoribacterium kuwaitense TaxID=1398745 RepID=UPI0013E9BA9A|nr:MBL fold metallo-hydrolase [Litoribacterium kuwaitense]NGP44479.1 MBL fold metallo-hydrolase [Litoribacterium kuwaitense]
MKVTVLGIWGGFPGAGGATAGYLFEYDHYRLLVDCGSGVLAQLQKHIKLETLDAVVLSHSHHDHVADIGPLHFSSLVHQRIEWRDHPLTIYTAPVDTPYISSLVEEPFTKVVHYDPEDELNIGPFQIRFSKTAHPVSCQAMRITAAGTEVGYTADTSWLDKWPLFFKNVDLLIAECSFYDGQDGQKAGHLTSTDCGHLAAEANVGELILTHLPHYGDHETLLSEAEAVFQGNVQIASTGLVWQKESTR